MDLLHVGVPAVEKIYICMCEFIEVHVYNIHIIVCFFHRNSSEDLRAQQRSFFCIIDH